MADSPPLALVTGAARGIGSAVAHQLGKAGYAVIVTARDPDRAEARAATLRADGHEATAVTLDVADPASVAGLASVLGDRPLEGHAAGPARAAPRRGGADRERDQRCRLAR